MVKWDRAAALDISVDAAKLLDESYFDDVCEALKTKDYERFNEICDKAQVLTGKNDDRVRKQLYAMLEVGLAGVTERVWP